MLLLSPALLERGVEGPPGDDVAVEIGADSALADDAGWNTARGLAFVFGFFAAWMCGLLEWCWCDVPWGMGNLGWLEMNE